MNAYQESILKLCDIIHTGVVDFDKPRNKASRPSQASSEFITNKQQGDWAEDVIFNAINENSNAIVAVKYGKSDNLIAGEAGFAQLYDEYQNELDEIGKRPDILLFKRSDFDSALGYDISSRTNEEINEYVRKAIAGIEVRSSAFLIDKYNEKSHRELVESTQRALQLRDIAINQYSDLLSQKCPALIPLLSQLDDVSVHTLSFKVPAWRASERLQALSCILSELKSRLKDIQKRNSLCITPKDEDLKTVLKWIQTYGVPHYYVQVFFDKAFGISFENILQLISNPDLEGKSYFVEKDNKNQNKTTIKIPVQDSVCLAHTVTEPRHHSVRKELNNGRLLFYVRFEGGEAALDAHNFNSLFSHAL